MLISGQIIFLVPSGLSPFMYVDFSQSGAKNSLNMQLELWSVEWMLLTVVVIFNVLGLKVN